MNGHESIMIGNFSVYKSLCHVKFINQLVEASYRLKKSFKYFTVEVLVMKGHLIDFFGKAHDVRSISKSHH